MFRLMLILIALVPFLAVAEDPYAALLRSLERDRTAPILLPVPPPQDSQALDSYLNTRRAIDLYQAGALTDPGIRKQIWAEEAMRDIFNKTIPKE